MKTEIKIGGFFEWITVEPADAISGNGGVVIHAGPAPTTTNSIRIDLNRDQASAVMWAMNEASEMARIREIKKNEREYREKLMAFATEWNANKAAEAEAQKQA